MHAPAAPLHVHYPTLDPFRELTDKDSVGKYKSLLDARWDDWAGLHSVSSFGYRPSCKESPA